MTVQNLLSSMTVNEAKSYLAIKNPIFQIIEIKNKKQGDEAEWYLSYKGASPFMSHLKGIPFEKLTVTDNLLLFSELESAININRPTEQSLDWYIAFYSDSAKKYSEELKQLNESSPKFDMIQRFQSNSNNVLKVLNTIRKASC